MTEARTVDVAIVGGGPAGLAAAVELARLGVQGILVLEREAELGGAPRHCAHTGFGLVDLRQILSGPAYAAHRASLLREAGVKVALETTVAGWQGPTDLVILSPAGTRVVSARAALLATGCRERSRAARRVAGGRPLGVFTTGSLQQLVHGARVRPGKRAVVVGAEHVSFSAARTLTRAGCEVVALVTEHPRHQTYAPHRWVVASLSGIPVVTGASVTEVIGRRRVEGVEIALKAGSEFRRLDCDTVVFTGDWIPEHEVARAAGIPLDPWTRGPVVDPGFRTAVPGIFASGNLLRGAEIADRAALEGQGAAQAIAAYLQDARWPSPELRVPVTIEPPLKWISPNEVSVGWTSHQRPFVLQSSGFLAAGLIEVRQGGEVLVSRHCWRMVPNRPHRIGGEWVGRVKAGAGPVRVSFRSAR